MNNLDEERLKCKELIKQRKREVREKTLETIFMGLIFLPLVLPLAIIILIEYNKKRKRNNPAQFLHLINILNEKAYSNEGHVEIINNKTYQLYNSTDWMFNKTVFIFHITYEVMQVTVEYGEKIVYEKWIDARTLSKEKQIAFANELYSEHRDAVARHIRLLWNSKQEYCH